MTISGSEPGRPSRRRVLAGLLPVAGLALAGPLWAAKAGATTSSAPRARLTGRAFGTGWTVLAEDLAGGAEALAAPIHAVLAEVDAAMSPFRPGSALSRFNAAHGEAPAGRGAEVVFPPEAQEVIGAALAMAAASEGAFDPCIGPAVGRYGFGPISGAYRPGSWRGLRLEGGVLRAEAPATLDLCGIAKGHAVDRIAALLAGRAGAFLVEIGGEIRVGGDWPVGIADPRGGGVIAHLRLTDQAIATSGDAVNGFAHGGRRWSHVIDPESGRPIENDVTSVSVVAASAMQADALATALMVLGPERGLALARRQGAEALFLLRRGAGLARAETPGFAALRA